MLKGLFSLKLQAKKPKKGINEILLYEKVKNSTICHVYRHYRMRTGRY